MAKIKQDINFISLKNLCYFYGAAGCIGGAILGFLSFGLMGLFTGLSIGALTSIMLKKGIQLLKTS